MPRYTDPETGKSIFSETSLEENEITEGLGLAREVKQPPSPTISEKVSKFIWPGAEKAKESFIKGTTTALGLVGAAGATALSPSPWSPALGYAAGERLGRGIETLTGVSKPETPIEAGIETAKDIGIGLLPYGIEKVVGIPKLVKEIIPRSFKTTTGKIFKGVKAPYEVEKGVTTGLRKGAEKSIGELQNVEQQFYETARAGTDKEILTGAKKIRFENTTKGLNNFETTETFRRLHPPEKAQIRSAMKKIREDISEGSRAGSTSMTAQEMEDVMETGTGKFIEGLGQVRMPATFTQGRANRGWLSRETHDAYKAENQRLGNAYKELKNMQEQDLEKAVGPDAWAGWKAADAFKTRKHLMDEMFGWKGKAEIKPGKYNFEKVKTNIKKISPERFEAAGFSKEEIQNLRSISDVNKFRSFVETHPLLKILIPVEVMNEILGLKLPMPSVTRAGRYILGRAIGI